jgi:hypothetical protein
MLDPIAAAVSVVNSNRLLNDRGLRTPSGFPMLSDGGDRLRLLGAGQDNTDAWERHLVTWLAQRTIRCSVDWFNNRRLLEPIGNIPPRGGSELLCDP